jgi:hypothetical protein
MTAQFKSVDELLADARSRLTRVTPEKADSEVRRGALIVDIRPAWQRVEAGEVPGSLIVERNHLEWRLHPGFGCATSAGRSRAALDRDLRRGLHLVAGGRCAQLDRRASD